MRVNQLMEEGFYNQQEDYVEVTLRLAPGNYYQACADQLRLIEEKQALIDENRAVLGSKECIVSTAESIEGVKSPRYP